MARWSHVVQAHHSQKAGAPQAFLKASPLLDPTSLLAKQAARHAGSKADSCSFFYGTCAFGLLLFTAGAAPWLLPAVFLLFTATAIPWRAVYYFSQGWQFFLVDFCYFVNVATAMYLLWWPDNARLGALVYAMADGPLAAALVAWQCAWCFGSGDNAISVLMHLLPGLAVFSHLHHTPASFRGWRGMAQHARHLLREGRWEAPAGAAPAVAWGRPLLPWLLVAPFAFYLAWQLLYFLIVQVVCRAIIRRKRYDTSYNCLARRAAKTNNFWNRLVRRGPIWRRCLMYGALQLAFTVVAVSIFLPTAFCYPLALVYQVAKFGFPLWYGSRAQCEKAPQHAFLRGLRALNELLASAALPVEAGGLRGEVVVAEGAVQPWAQQQQAVAAAQARAQAKLQEVPLAVVRLRGQQQGVGRQRKRA